MSAAIAIDSVELLAFNARSPGWDLTTSRGLYGYQRPKPCETVGHDCRHFQHGFGPTVKAGQMDAKERQRARMAAFLKANPNYHREYYLSHSPEKRAAMRQIQSLQRAERRKNNPQKARAQDRVRRDKERGGPPPEKETAEQREARRLAKLQRFQQATTKRYQSDPLFNLKKRMSSALRGALKARGISKDKAHWLVIVGYTGDELRRHIERQFLRGMGWHNMPEWHVDHIQPLVSFRYTSFDDPEFRAAWALTNLRPIWAVENVRKNARREFLL